MSSDRPAAGFVLVDTDVWSHLYSDRRHRHPRTQDWRDALAGLTVVTSFQTRAELIGGWLAAEWGANRLAQVQAQLDQTPTLPLDEATISADAELYAECRRMGHALHDRLHTGDRWIAATARAYGIPLLAIDGIFRNVPGLILFDPIDDETGSTQ